METQPAESHDSTAPENASEDPVTAVPTSSTTPVWAKEAVNDQLAEPAGTVASEPAETTAVPAAAAEKADPDWTEPEPSTNGGGARTGRDWAATVPSSPGEAITQPEAAVPAELEAEPAEPNAEPVAPKAGVAAEDVWSDSVAGEPVPDDVVAAEVTPAPISSPPTAVAADALKSTWPPRAEGAPAPPVETDIWPPDPPTEKAMPAWRPPSEMEEPATPAQAIPSWPDSFDSTPAPAAAQAGPAAPETAPTVPPSTPPARPASTPGAPAASAAPAAPAVPAPPAPAALPAEPRADTAPPTEPKTIPPSEPPGPVAPASSGPPARPAWAPSAAPPAAGAAPPASQPVPTNFQVPAWAPRVPLAAEPGTPTWFSPKEQIPHTTSQPVAKVTPPQPQQPPPPAPAPPAAGGQLPVAQIPAAPAAPAAPTQSASAKPTWQVVEQARPTKAPTGPTAEDRSYAEWFAWAKRGGAPASACHAAAQGAFKALSSGKDVSTAVQWATAAMSRPPENVTYARQTYCAWFALANIDLNLDQHRAHSFAGAAVVALDNGADASQAHAAGLAAAGIR